MKLVRKYTPLILFIGLVALVILNASSFISGAISLFDVTSTLIYGAVIAFVLNVPMKKIEQYLVKLKVKAELRRPIAMVLVFLAHFGKGSIELSTFGVDQRLLRQWHHP